MSRPYAADDFDEIARAMENQRQERAELLLCKCVTSQDGSEVDTKDCPIHGGARRQEGASALLPCAPGGAPYRTPQEAAAERLSAIGVNETVLNHRLRGALLAAMLRARSGGWIP